MTPDRRLLSIVCPAYEEEAVLPAFHAALTSALQPLEKSFAIEIIYVDDGSADGTFGVIGRLAASDSRVRGLSLSRNFGHQAALTAGLEHARGEAVVMLDSDLQHPPALIPELVARWQAGFDVVQTIRAEDPSLSWFKRASSRWFYRLLRRWSNLDVRPAAADFRLLSRRALNSLLRMRESQRFLRGMVLWLGFPAAEIHFCADRRRAGVSKYTLVKMVRLALDGVYSFSQAPLRLAVATGLAATGLSLLISTAWVLSSRAGGWLAAELVAAHLMIAGLFLSIGSLGAYVGRIYDECKNRPLYVVKGEIPAAAAGREYQVRAAA